MNDKRPNPDAILSRIIGHERKEGRGRFRLFFGMAAGVGKTYAMLRAAHDRIKEGVNVWAGFVETYGRPDTIKMAEGVPVIPRKKIEYRGAVLEEMDIDAILAKRPALVLVDELAHTNVPGSRHEKRYRDVIEILDAGIDVYSTLNVQHLESRSDIVSLVTATQVRETLPDSILDLVDQIEIIDIAPKALIERMKDGKIYPGRKTETALQYFFQESNLNALREIALRATADKVERDMRGEPSIMTGTDKVLVAVSQSPYSERLIRTARRVVEGLDMPLLAVHVDSGNILSEADQNQLMKNMDLARELGAETVTLHGTNIADVITDFAKEQNVVQIIIGRPIGKQRWSPFSKTTNFIEELIRKNPKIDITVLQQSESFQTEQKIKIKKKFAWFSILKGVVAVCTISILSGLVDEIIGYRAVGFVFLLLVVVLGTILPFSAVLISAVLSSIIWNYFFIPPTGTFTISEPEDVMMYAAYLIIACTSGFLTYQTKRNQNILKDREEKTRALYEILKSMTSLNDVKTTVEFALSKIENLFHGYAAVFLIHDAKLLNNADYGKMELAENDFAVAMWSLENGKKAGWRTDTLPKASILSLPLFAGDEIHGILALKPELDRRFNSDQENLLHSIAGQIALVLAKQKYDEEIQKIGLIRESEKIHQILLNSVSHELRTPLTAIMGAATAMKSQLKETNSKSILLDEIIRGSQRLNYVFKNLLDMTRIESGMLKLKKEWFDASELVTYVVGNSRNLVGDHAIKVYGCEGHNYLNLDFDLIEHAFSNILLNAVNYSPKGSEIRINVERNDKQIFFHVSDNGTGIPEKLIPHIFDKFYRLPGTPSGGLGLGLSIAKNIVELQGGHIEVKNNPGGGATFSIVLPFKEPPQEIKEI